MVIPARSDPELAWAAGFIDGEGSLGVYHYSGGRRAARAVRHAPRITATNTVEIPIRRLRSWFGGKVSYSQRSEAWRGVFVWDVTSMRAVEVARLLLPYLCVKQAQASLLIEFADDALWSNGGSDRAVPEDEYARREALYDRTRELNRRGPITETDREETPRAAEVAVRTAGPA